MLETKLTSQEQALKRNWLILLIISSVLGLLFDEQFMRSGKVGWMQILENLGSIYGYYYCAYKKHGTKLLLFSLITSPGIIFYFAIVRNAFVQHQWITGCFQLIFCMMFIWWCVLSFRLRKLNKRIQMEELEELYASDDYTQAIASIREATSLDDLKSCFSHASRERSDPFMSALLKEYELKKAYLSNEQSQEKPLVDH